MKMCSRARYVPSRTRPVSASISRAGSPAKIGFPRRSAATSLADIGGSIARAAAVPARCSDPTIGEPLRRELEGLRKFRVRRYRVVYEVIRDARIVRVLAVRHRRGIYEEVTERTRKA